MERSDSHDSASTLEGDNNAMEKSMDKEAVTQAVQVALNIRPLIAQERSQGCKDCIRVVPREPQVVPPLENLSLPSSLHLYCVILL
jgi:hypothetical protein